MPIYEYRCHECGKTFEVRQNFSDEPLILHEGCGGSLEKLISTSVLNFKGTGWYVTDYARKGKSRSTNGSTGTSESRAESKTEGKTEGKAEAKAESKSESKAESKSESKPAPAPAKQ
jgi:putative FmdB family regulatory protein